MCLRDSAEPDTMMSFLSWGDSACVFEDLILEVVPVRGCGCSSEANVFLFVCSRHRSCFSHERLCRQKAFNQKSALLAVL